MVPPPSGLPPRGNSTLSSSSNHSTIPTFPRPAAPNNRDVSTTSTLTIDTADELSAFPTIVKPIKFSEARDVSSSSRDSLRRQLLHRRTSLTPQEHQFLEHLCVNGNEIEVELAMETLADDELFFDYQTPRHLKYQPLGSKENDDNTDSRQAPSPRPGLDRQSSAGSQRRLKKLEQRRNDAIQSKMWKAHENGLAVTTSGSRRSMLLRRASSVGSSSTGVRRGSDTVFRKVTPLPKSNSQQQPPKARTSYPRPQSMIALVPPPIPGPSRLMRESTSSSRKSVTFTGLEAGVGTPKLRSKTLRRSVSDSIQYAVAQVQKDDKEEQENHPQGVLGRQESNASIPSLHHGAPVRSDSISSIPSLHHAHAVREASVSTSSIPSIHHAHSIHSTAGSIHTIPSLHHAHAIRSDSIASIPSLHHAHPLRDSISSSVGGTNELLQATQDATALRLSQYSAADDIASKWLQQRPNGIIIDDQNAAFPDSVTIPITETHTTEAESTEAETTIPPISTNTTSTTTSSSSTSRSKPVLMRLASQNRYEGEGIEVTELEDTPRPEFVSLFSMDASIRTASSWDEASAARYSHSEIFRSIHRSLSDDDMANMFLGTTAANLLFTEMSIKRSGGYNDLDDEDSSWDMNSDSDGRFDSWNILKDDYVNGYGGGGTLGFSILGTSADDVSAQPHVLSPPLMESLQAFVPYSKSGENFFLKYSMVRDGASLHAFLKRARGVDYSIVAIETLEGEVFGAFTAQPWRKNWNYFGTGESFLWRMRRSRQEKTNGILEQAQLESEIDVYPYTGENKFIQLCTHDRIAVGGGTPSGEKKTEDPVESHEWGFGLAIEHDFLQGSSSPCVTFGSPSLSKVHCDGSTFEIVNMELWTLTPCVNVEEAEKLELGKLFLERRK